MQEIRPAPSRWDSSGLSSEGRGNWAAADAGYTWSIRNVSHVNHLMGTAGQSVLLVAKAELGVRERFSQLLWIQYTEALLDGKIHLTRRRQ